MLGVLCTTPPSRPEAGARTAQVSEAQADELVQWEEAQRYPLAAEAVGVHVMARETQLREIVASCEGGRA